MRTGRGSRRVSGRDGAERRGLRNRHAAPPAEPRPPLWTPVRGTVARGPPRAVLVQQSGDLFFAMLHRDRERGGARLVGEI